MSCSETRHRSGRPPQKSRAFGKPSVAVVLIGGLLLQAYACVARRIQKSSLEQSGFGNTFGVPTTPGSSPASSPGSSPASSPRSSGGKENLQPISEDDFCHLPVRGLTNADDSSCFINSAMQFVLAVPGLCEVVFNQISLLAGDQARGLKTISPASDAGQSFLRAYLKMFRKVYSSAGEFKPVGFKAIDEFRAGLHHVKLVNGRHGEEDSQEFLLSLLNRFNDSAKEQASVLSHVSKYQQFKWENPLSVKEDLENKEGASSLCNEDSPPVCKTTATQEETVMILLPIQLPFSTSTTGTSLQDKFNLEFGEAEIDDAANALKANKDGKMYEFAKWSMHTEAKMPPPKYLLFGYKRFDLNYNTFDPIKLDDDVTTPLHMLHPACYQNPTYLNNTLCKWHYRLEAVVQHIGTSADTGHYISAVRGRGSAEERQKWYNVSDSFVNEITSEEVREIAGKCLYAGYVLADADDVLNGEPYTNGQTADSGSEQDDSYGKLVLQDQTTGLWRVEISDGVVLNINGKSVKMGKRAGRASENGLLEAGAMVRLREVTIGRWVVELPEDTEVGGGLEMELDAMKLSNGNEEVL